MDEEPASQPGGMASGSESPYGATEGSVSAPSSTRTSLSYASSLDKHLILRELHGRIVNNTNDVRARFCLVAVDLKVDGFLRWCPRTTYFQVILARRDTTAYGADKSNLLHSGLGGAWSSRRTARSAESGSRRALHSPSRTRRSPRASDPKGRRS